MPPRPTSLTHNATLFADVMTTQEVLSVVRNVR
jgi:hypothetical protein